jgi:hypothetical protein
MGILTDAFIAADAEVHTPTFPTTGPAGVSPTVEAKRVDTVQVGTLKAIVMEQSLRAIDEDVQGFVASLESEFPCVRDLGEERGDGPVSHGPWAHRIPQVLVTRLAKLTPAAIQRYGATWAGSGQWMFVATPPSPKQVASIVEFWGGCAGSAHVPKGRPRTYTCGFRCNRGAIMAGAHTGFQREVQEHMSSFGS